MEERKVVVSINVKGSESCTESSADLPSQKQDEVRVVTPPAIALHYGFKYAYKFRFNLFKLESYTQSGSLFHSKTRALHKALTKALPTYSIHLSYPTGPIHLDPADIPGYNGPSTGEAERDLEPAYGWWRRKDVPHPSKNGETEIVYTGIQDGFARIAETIREEGPFDGVIGFSQGACAAGMVASLLEHGRQDTFSSPISQKDGMETEPFPPSFTALRHPTLKFAIIYSGFIAPGTRYSGFYNPSLKTPTLRFLGALDGVVEEGRSQGLINVCESAKVVTHPGGHFLPSQRPWLDAAVGFLKECLEKTTNAGGDAGKDDTREKVDKVEDMEVPF
ncbi:MAG: hypothetical protein Q9213_000211 [Squamulea squamosa]